MSHQDVTPQSLKYMQILSPVSVCNNIECWFSVGFSTMLLGHYIILPKLHWAKEGVVHCFDVYCCLMHYKFIGKTIRWWCVKHHSVLVCLQFVVQRDQQMIKLQSSLDNVSLLLIRQYCLTYICWHANPSTAMFHHWERCCGFESVKYSDRHV